MDVYLFPTISQAKIWFIIQLKQPFTRWAPTIVINGIITPTNKWRKKQCVTRGYFTPVTHRIHRTGIVTYIDVSGDNWMYPYQRTPMGNPYICTKRWVFMGYPQESLENTINTMGTRTLGVKPIVP